MDTYEQRKERTRQKAIDWQCWASAWNISYGELAKAQDYFTKLGKRYGLLWEFRENGLI